MMTRSFATNFVSEAISVALINSVRAAPSVGWSSSAQAAFWAESPDCGRWGSAVAELITSTGLVEFLSRGDSHASKTTTLIERTQLAGSDDEQRRTLVPRQAVAIDVDRVVRASAISDVIVFPKSSPTRTDPQGFDARRAIIVAGANEHALTNWDTFMDIVEESSVGDEFSDYVIDVFKWRHHHLSGAAYSLVGRTHFTSVIVDGNIIEKAHWVPPGTRPEEEDDESEDVDVLGRRELAIQNACSTVSKKKSAAFWNEKIRRDLCKSRGM